MRMSKSLSTREVAPWLAKNLVDIGVLTSIVHIADPDKADYETMFFGTNDAVRVVDGFSSGYHGEGSRGLYDFLVALGIDASFANKFVFAKYEPNAGPQKRVLHTGDLYNMDAASLIKVANSFSLKEYVFEELIEGMVKGYVVWIPKGNYKLCYIPEINEYRLYTPKGNYFTIPAKMIEVGNLSELQQRAIPQYVIQYLDKNIQNGLIPYIKRKVR